MIATTVPDWFQVGTEREWRGSHGLSPKLPIAQATPSLLPEHWHLAVLHSGSVVFTATPVWAEQVGQWFRLRAFNMATATWHSLPCVPKDVSPFHESAPSVNKVTPAPEPARKNECLVYFIQSGVDGPIKIGITNNITARFKALQTGSPVGLRLLTTLPGSSVLESTLHQRFSHLRLHGEWFSSTDELLGFVNSIQGTENFHAAD